jgi:hypothetical protein
VIFVSDNLREKWIRTKRITFYGTPIEREEEFTSRKKKAVAEASGNLRSLPVWKQEVRLKSLTPGSHFPPLVWFLGKLRIVKPK